MSISLASRNALYDPTSVTKFDVDRVGNELAYEIKRLKSDQNFRFSQLEFKIECLQRDIERAHAMRRQYAYLVLSVLFSVFVVALTFV